MRVILYAIVALAFGAAPSFSSPMLAVGNLQATRQVPRDTSLQPKHFAPIVARKKKAAESASAAPATATPAAPAAGGATIKLVKIGEEGSQKIKTNGFFGTPNTVVGGFVFTKVLLPTNVSLFHAISTVLCRDTTTKTCKLTSLILVQAVGLIEPEFNGTATNSITVVPKTVSIPPPAGLVYVDPLTFVISTVNPPAAGDTMKVDYIFTEATKLAVDVAQMKIGKLDTAANQFVTEGVGELEFEKEENELSLTVADMNGEWGIFVPETAVLPATAGEGED
jgi:hypothetical protein